MSVSLEWNWYFNIYQLACCCIYIVGGTRMMKFMSARFSFREALHYVHPSIINQMSYWWLSPSVALLVVSILGLNEEELRVKQLLAIPLVVAFALWSLNNEGMFWQNQTHFDWEADEKHESPYPEPSFIEKPFMLANKQNGTAARMWGMFGACGVVTARNTLYVVDPEKFQVVIVILGCLEVSLLGLCLMCMMRFYWKAGIVHELMFKPAQGFDMTKNHLLPYALPSEEDSVSHCTAVVGWSSKKGSKKACDATSPRGGRQEEV
jgi:hypothetical protein